MIFGIGLNKTGTFSLYRAFELLGLRCEYDGTLLSNAQLAELQAVSTFQDPPPFERLAADFPAARFVLTTRNREEWITSRIVHVLWSRLTDDPHWRTHDTVADAALFDDYHARVEGFFAGTGRLLRMDLSAGDGWDYLCPFLGCAPPRVAFPRRNTGAGKLRECLALYERADDGRQPTV